MVAIKLPPMDLKEVQTDSSSRYRSLFPFWRRALVAASQIEAQNRGQEADCRGDDEAILDSFYHGQLGNLLCNQTDSQYLGNTRIPALTGDNIMEHRLQSQAFVAVRIDRLCKSGIVEYLAILHYARKHGNSQGGRHLADNIAQS